MINEPRFASFSEIPCYSIDERTRDEYLGKGFSPLSNTDSLERHKSEWTGVLQRLSDALSQHWVRGFGDGDFFIDTDPVPDRLLCVEVSELRMLTPRLPELIHRVVAETEVPYSIDICDSWGYLKTETGDAYPHFNVFVETERLLVYTESADFLRRLELHAVPFPRVV